MDVPEFDGVIAASSDQETRDMAAQTHVCKVRRGGGGGGEGRGRHKAMDHVCSILPGLQLVALFIPWGKLNCGKNHFRCTKAEPGDEAMRG